MDCQGRCLFAGVVLYCAQSELCQKKFGETPKVYLNQSLGPPCESSQMLLTGSPSYFSVWKNLYCYFRTEQYFILLIFSFPHNTFHRVIHCEASRSACYSCDVTNKLEEWPCSRRDEGSSDSAFLWQKFFFSDRLDTKVKFSCYGLKTSQIHFSNTSRCDMSWHGKTKTSVPQQSLSLKTKAAAFELCACNWHDPGRIVSSRAIKKAFVSIKVVLHWPTYNANLHDDTMLREKSF